MNKKLWLTILICSILIIAAAFGTYFAIKSYQKTVRHNQIEKLRQFHDLEILNRHPKPYSPDPMLFGLSAWTVCTDHGLYWLCENGLPDPSLDFGTKGIEVTGTVAFSSNSGGAGQSGEDINLTYDVEHGIRFKDATVVISSGSGGGGSGPGGYGGDILINLSAPKVIFENVKFNMSSGSGGDADAPSCDADSGGAGGDIRLILDTANYEFINTSIDYILGSGGEGDASGSCPDYLECHGGNGGGAGNAYFTAGSNSTSIGNLTNFNLSMDGSGGGLSDAACDGSDDYDSACGAGGTSSSYSMIFNGVVNGSNPRYSTTAETAGEPVCRASCDGGPAARSLGGAQGGSVVFDFGDRLVSDGQYNLYAGHSSNSDAATCGGGSGDGAPGTRGGAITLYGLANVSSGTVSATTGNGGNAKEAGTSPQQAFACGGGGSVTWNLNETNFYNDTVSITHGTNGNGDGGHTNDAGGSSGGVSLNGEDWYFDKGSLTWTTRAGCNGYYGAGSDYAGGTGSYWTSTLTDDMTWSDVSVALTGGDGGTGGLASTGGWVWWNATGDTLVHNSLLSFSGGAGAAASGTPYGGSGRITTGKINFTSSNITVSKAAGAGGYVNTISADGPYVTNCNSSRVLFVNPNDDGTDIFRFNNTEVRYLNCNMTYTGKEPGWKTYADYLTTNAGWVLTTMNVYNYSGVTQSYYNVSTSGIWIFNTGKTSASNQNDYDSRALAANVTYNGALAWKNLAYVCAINYSIGSGWNYSVLWYRNSTWVNNGTSYNATAGPLHETDSLKCSLMVYNSSSSKTNNDTEVIAYGYPYNMKLYVGNSFESQDYSGQYNSTMKFDFKVGGFNEYIQYFCDNQTVCNIPIYFTSETNLSTLNITVVNVSYGSDTVTNGYVNLTIWMNSSQAGKIVVNDPVWTYVSNVESPLRIRAHSNITNGTADYFDFDRYINMLYSKFNVSLPWNVDYYDVYPLWPTQQNVQPFGQKTTVPVFKINASQTNHSFSVYMRTVNGTQPSCVNTTFNKNNTNALGIHVNNSYQNITGVASNGTASLWSWSNFNCTYNQTVVYFPVFRFKALCSGCVETPDFWTYDYPYVEES